MADFDAKKIRAAFHKAFMAKRITVSEQMLDTILDNVIQKLEANFPASPPGVEDVQDAVEHELMKEGYFGVAKAYIIYRYEHTKKREEIKEEIEEKIKKQDLNIINRSGKTEPFSFEKLKKSIGFSAKGLEDAVDVNSVALQCQSELYEKIPSEDIERASILAARSFIEKDPAYSSLASRLLRAKLYKEVIGHEKIDFKRLDDQYKSAFIRNIIRGVEMKRLDKRAMEFDLHALAGMLKPERDDLIVYLGLQTLYDRYFIYDVSTKTPLETPQAFWMRVAMGLAMNEKEKEKYAEKFYEVLSTLRFVSSTPTLFHSLTLRPQLSSCYITTVMDSLDHIFSSIGNNAQLSKWSGGIANDWTNVRGTGAYIKGTGVESQGVVPFLKIANDTTVAINRSGRRRGATCAYLEIWHYDIEEFLELRKNTGDERRRTHDMNTANWIPDLFMQRLRQDGYWTLFSPDETSDLHHTYGRLFQKRYEEYEQLAEIGKIRLHKKIRAKDLWKKMLTMLFETGHPWITFKDPCNARSPQDHVGIVHSSNLCTEITLNTSKEETAVCNLGSVNLSRHIVNGKLNKSLIKDTVTTAMRMLDNVIDINYYPTTEAKYSNLRHRPVGLGIMGFQDALFQMNLRFDSDEAIEFADQSMEAISYHAIFASCNLAKERGAYMTYPGSKWDRGILPLDTLDLLETERGEKIPVSRDSTMDWDKVRQEIKKYGMRNSNCMAVAPTATIANIAGCFPSIEPIYKNMYVKSNMSGEFTITNTYLVNELKSIGAWNEDIMEDIKRNDGSIALVASIPKEIKEKYKETFEIDSSWFIRIAAHRGKWIDQSQSLNIFIKGTSGRIISETYQLAWEMGLKTTYYLRSMGATSVEKSSIHLQKKTALEGADATVENASFVAGKEASDMIFSHIKNDAVVAKPKLCAIEDPTCESCQ